MQSPIEFVRKLKLPYKIVNNGKAILLRECPLCSAKDKFSLHSISGRYKCESCQDSGSLYDLKVKLGIISPIDTTLAEARLTPLSDFHINNIEKSYNNLIKNKKRLEDLFNWRPYTEEAVHYFKLGLHFSEEDNIEYLVYPLSFNKKYYNAMLRSWRGYPKEFTRIPGAPTILMNADVLLEKPKEVVIAEGVVDTVSIWSAGIRNVVGVISGAKSSLSSIFVDLLEPVEKIIIIFDGDDTGRSGAKKLAKQLGLHRCYIADPGDGLDATDYIKIFGKERFKELLESAKPAQIGDVEEFLTVAERLAVTPDVDDTISTGFTNLDGIIQGYSPDGFLITLASPPKSGKTTFAGALALDFARREGPALFFCLEMEKEKVAKLLISQLTSCYRNINNVEAGIFLLNKVDVPVYQAFMGAVDAENILETIREAFYRFGIRFVVFDNLHYLVRGVENKASVLADIIKEFALLTKELGLVTVLIAQPRKIVRKKGFETEMTGSDLAWSSAFETDSDLLLIINRPRIYKKSQTFASFFKVVVEASRYAPGGVAYFYLDKYSACVLSVSGKTESNVASNLEKIYEKGEKNASKN